MTSLNRNRPQVKSARQFAEGLIDPQTGQVASVKPYTAADLAEWMIESNKDCRDYDVVIPAPAPISGGAPDWDRLADESAFMDRYERGQF